MPSTASRFADGDGFDAHGGSFDYKLRYGPEWPRRTARASELWRMLGGPAPPAGRGTGSELLIALDGDKAGKRAREIAEELWGADRVLTSCLSVPAAVFSLPSSSVPASVFTMSPRPATMLDAFR